MCLCVFPVCGVCVCLCVLCVCTRVCVLCVCVCVCLCVVDGVAFMHEIVCLVALCVSIFTSLFPVL